MAQKESKMHKVYYGNNERYSFSKIKKSIEMPYLIEVQRRSYEQFVKNGIKEAFEYYSPITDSNGRFVFEFFDVNTGDSCKYTMDECIDRELTYTFPLRVKARLTNKVTGAITEKELYIGDIPKMTEKGSFIINGSERVIVSQLVRSPGVITKVIEDKFGVKQYHTEIIPQRGTWIEFDLDDQNNLTVKVDKKKKFSATIFLRALGFGTDNELRELFNNNPIIEQTLSKDSSKERGDSGKEIKINSTALALAEMYRKMNPGTVPTEAALNELLKKNFFDDRKYTLAKVGRYKLNKRLSLANIAVGRTLSRDVDVVDGIFAGERIANKGDVLTYELANAIQNAGVNEIFVYANDNREIKLIGNRTVDAAAYLGIPKEKLDIKEKVVYDELLELIMNSMNRETGMIDNELLINLLNDKDNKKRLVPMCVRVEDIVAAVSYIINMKEGFWRSDDIDHLSNRRVKMVGELVENNFRTGLSRLEKFIRDKLQISQAEGNEITPQSLVNTKLVSGAVTEFFSTSQLSQFLDQPNPVAELTNKRKLSALGPGGLNRERAGFEVRDVHPTHYGRMCPIETPEGQNIGLITSLSSYARINEYGFIEAPYRKVIDGKITDETHYLTADEEDNYIIAHANEPITEDGKFINEFVTCRFRDEIKEYPVSEVNYIDCDPKQLVSVAASLIPFLENDDATRALMGSNMQRQAVPILAPESPIVATGMEYKVAYDSGVCVVSKDDGVVKSVTADKIIITRDDGTEAEYDLQKFKRSNQETCVNQRPIVSKGDKVVGEKYDYDDRGALVKVKDGTVLADGSSTQNGELALGRNILIGFATWEGYNYEDAILISEELVRKDIFTTIHIECIEIEARATKLGDEIITNDIPGASLEVIKHLGEDGIVMIGSKVRDGDYLVGKITPKGENEPSPEERLLAAILKDKSKEYKDVSLKVPHGGGGTVVGIKVLTKEDKLDASVIKKVKVFIAQRRKLQVGDKMSGRHGNKGVISRILPKEDMPFLEDGTPLQIVLNPLGVPSRMNIGQVLEVHLGYVAKKMGIKIATPVFDGAHEEDIKNLYLDNGLFRTGENGEKIVDGKQYVYDGRTGEKFENPITVGYMYMIKLNHQVDDKMHARSTGPYALVTQQPLGGKAQFGGQRFGEMEVWALEAYGASNILKEVLTVKSDDRNGRKNMYSSIMNDGANASLSSGIPEAFKVMQKEMQSLCLDIRLYNTEGDEVELPENHENEKSPFEKNEGFKRAEKDVNISSLYQSPSVGQNDYSKDVILGGSKDSITNSEFNNDMNDTIGLSNNDNGVDLFDNINFEDDEINENDFDDMMDDDYQEEIIDDRGIDDVDDDDLGDLQMTDEDFEKITGIKPDDSDDE